MEDELRTKLSSLLYHKTESSDTDGSERQSDNPQYAVSCNSSVVNECVVKDSDKTDEELSSSPSPIPVYGKCKQYLSPETKEFLNRVFARKKTLNNKEKEVVASKCGITKAQVKNWFMNKRMRTKTSNSL